MTAALLGLPAEIETRHRFVIVDTPQAASQARRLLPSQIVLWPPDGMSLSDLPLEAWMVLNGSDVLLWPTNLPQSRAVMETIAKSLTRLTDRLRMLYASAEDPVMFSAAAMSDWTTSQLAAWAKVRVLTWKAPPAAPDPMEAFALPAEEFVPRVAESTAYPQEDEEPQNEAPPREPGCDDDLAPPEDPYPALRMRWSELEGKTPPDRIWVVDHWLTQGPTLLAGQGGIGKTLLAQQLGTAISLGINYVDKIPQAANVLFWACEDDHDELWRRQLAICQYFGIRLSDLEGKLIIEPRLGLENGLMVPEYHAPTWTERREVLREQVNDYKASVLIVDNIGQVFGGNENDRHHVTAFLSGLVGLSHAPLSVLMLGHPAKSLNSEYSGSTAWEAAVRMRWYLGARLPDAKPTEEDGEPDTSIRYLCKRKANYSRLDYRQLTFKDGIYDCPTIEALTMSMTDKYGGGWRKEALEQLLLAAVGQFFNAGIRVVYGPSSPDHLIKRMRSAVICQDYTDRELNQGLTQLMLRDAFDEAPVGQYKNRAAKHGLAPKGTV